MKEKFLTLEQNTCSARIFLNTFGLILDNFGEIDAFSKIKIFDKTGKEVGELHFDNGKVFMQACFDENVLQANFDMAIIHGFIDRESDNAIYDEWNNRINFQVQKQDNAIIKGEFILSCTADTQFGIICTCHPTIEFENFNLGKVNLKMNIDGCMFEVAITSNENSETIEIRPGDWLNGFIRHDIRHGKYSEEYKGLPYRKYSGIFKGAENGEHQHDLQVFLSEEKDGKDLDSKNDFIKKVNEDNSVETSIQAGNLMQELDPAMFRKIEELKDYLLIGDTSLLNNLVSICFDYWPDEMITALLGIKREKMQYQNGTDNLKNSYFGIGKDSCFLSLEEQKRLLEKK